jgi:hypothetical protein
MLKSCGGGGGLQLPILEIRGSNLDPKVGYLEVCLDESQVNYRVLYTKICTLTMNTITILVTGRTMTSIKHNSSK